MSELFQKSRSTINEHILNIYEEGELDNQSSMRKIGISDFSINSTDKALNKPITKPKLEISVEFFQTVQNKMHFAAHGNTAAEVIYQRINAAKPNAGLTNFKGKIPTEAEIQIAKNYLNENELKILNRMVSGYLEIAEIQALNQTPMYRKIRRKSLMNF
jgi:hypothetical protein